MDSYNNPTPFFRNISIESSNRARLSEALQLTYKSSSILKESPFSGSRILTDGFTVSITKDSELELIYTLSDKAIDM